MLKLYQIQSVFISLKRKKLKYFKKKYYDNGSVKNIIKRQKLKKKI
jgi:hypothetical protein